MAYKKKEKQSKETDKNEVAELVRKMETNHISGSTTISKYVSWSLYENIEKIDAYLNSKHTSGSQDSLGRDKPFFNIVTAAVNIWFRATDIDRKHIKIKPTSAKTILPAFLANIHLQNWMRKSGFGVFLNNWGRTLARYGSSVIKFVEKDGELIPNVVPWNRLIVDSIDFNNNLKIEILELTEAQLRERGYDEDVVESLCSARTSRKTKGGQNKDDMNDYIRLYEVHGEMPLSYLTGKEKDKNTYVQQMHVISFVGTEKKGDLEDFSLIKGKEKDPYMITHLIEEDGRVQAIGAVEHLFEAQWMVNHTAKAIKDQLDLASKLIFQTSDGNYIGRNALTSIENGDILVHNVNEPLTQLANTSHDIASIQSYGNQWRVLAQEITSTPDSLRGNTMPSGTAWRQVEAIQSEANSLFELMTENKGLAIEEMMKRFVIPFLKKKFDTSEEISASLDSYDIQKIDRLYIKSEVNKKLNDFKINKILQGDIVRPEEEMSMMQGETESLRESLSDMGDKRFFVPSDIKDKTWKEIFKDLELEVEVDVTGEASDTQTAITTLTTVLKTIAGNPAILQDENARMVFNKILSVTGTVSPLELNKISNPATPSGGQMVGAGIPEEISNLTQ